MRRQGSQFTSTEFIKVLAGREIKISMDGKGAWRDNVFVERLWRTIKYEAVYLRAYASVSEARVSEARASIGRYLGFYNTIRRRTRTNGIGLLTPHSNRWENDPPDRFLIRIILDGNTPDQAYFNGLTPVSVAA